MNKTSELMLPMWWLRQLAAFIVVAAASLVWSGQVDARLKGESSFIGSALPSFIDSAAPSDSASKYVVVVAALDHPSPGTQSGSLGGLFNRPGLLGGFASGFLGAGLLGLFFGRGIFAELNSVAAYLGLAFQLVLVAMLCRLIWVWWTGRNQPLFSGLSPRQLADPYLRTRHDLLPGGASSSIDDVEDTAEPKRSEQRTQSAAAGEH